MPRRMVSHKTKTRFVMCYLFRDVNPTTRCALNGALNWQVRYGNNRIVKPIPRDWTTAYQAQLVQLFFSVLAVSVNERSVRAQIASCEVNTTQAGTLGLNACFHSHKFLFGRGYVFAINRHQETP